MVDSFGGFFIFLLLFSQNTIDRFRSFQIQFYFIQKISFCFYFLFFFFYFFKSSKVNEDENIIEFGKINQVLNLGQ